MKKLEGLEFVPHWVSHLGCLDGCLRYLGLDVSTPWLFGATGHAFVINIEEGLCPSGPTAWNTTMIDELAPNIGLGVEEIFARKEDEDFEEKKEEAWRFVRGAIDAGRPCFGWQIGDIADFYTIYGYDDTGYYYKGYFQKEGAGPKPWEEIGQMFLEVYGVERTDPADDATTVKRALQNALRHSENPKEWIRYPKYRSGIEGSDAWIGGVEGGTAATFGNAYNAAVWEECRRFGVEFLKEARGRLNGEIGPLFEEAIGHYGVVARQLASVSELYPFDPELTMDPIGIDDRSREAVKAIEVALDSEAEGLKALARIVDAL